LEEAHLPRNLKLTLSYDGYGYHGWQIQPGVPTVQGLLAEVIESLTGERLLPQASGRTDAGVHALAQVASFRTGSPIPLQNLKIVLNDRLPPSIRVLSVEEAAPDFHARHSARAKTYEYRIYRGEVCPPFLFRYAWHYPYPLDEAAMAAAAALVVGEHDFTSFAAADPDRSERAALEESTRANATTPFGGVCSEERETPVLRHCGRGPQQALRLRLLGSNVRTIFESQLDRRPAEPWPAAETSPSKTEAAQAKTETAQARELVYRVRGNGFLHHMVRNLVGTFLLVGKGTLTPADIPRILAARDRSAAGPTAPACGLWLVGVEY
jgi:tRNA pseudouridine38-40 synthase